MTEKVKPLDLSAIIRDAFLSGRGLKDGDKLSEEDQKAWMDYDPTEHRAYKRIYAALYDRPRDKLDSDMPQAHSA